MKLPRLKTFLCVLLLLWICPSQKAHLPSPKRERLFYTNQERNDLKRTLLKSFSKAQREIGIIVYSLTDPSLIKILNKKANEGLLVTLWVDKKQLRSLKKKLSSKITLFSRPQRGLMHQKIFISDDQFFIGSTNLTTTSLRMHDNFMLGLHSPKTVEKLKHYLLEGEKPSFDNEREVEFYFLPSQAALDRILSLIQSAKKSLYVAQFTFTHPLLCDALIQAYQRGVKVKVVMDYLSSKGASRFVAQKLREAHLPLFHNRGAGLMHHKMAFIDEDILILGSTNWTKSAFKKNQDDLLILKDLSTHEKKKLKKMWRHLFWDAKPYQ